MSSPLPNNDQMAKLSYNDVQRLVNDTEQLKNQLQFYLSQMDLLENSIADLDGSRIALKELKTKTKGETLLVPLGTQILLPVEITSNETVLHDLGSNILKDIPIDESIKKIESRIELFRKSVTTLSERIYQLENLVKQREDLLNRLVPASQMSK